MPPRYPQNDRSNIFGRKQPAADTYQQYHGSIVLNPNNVIPKGGTGATEDSFASSFKPQNPVMPQYLPSGLNANPNFSSLALTANSFQMTMPGVDSSFDVATAN